MSPYMLGDAGKLAATETPPLYDLYAVVNHYGAVHIGHYTAVVKPPCSEGEGDGCEEWEGCQRGCEGWGGKSVTNVRSNWVYMCVKCVRSGGCEGVRSKSV